MQCVFKRSLCVWKLSQCNSRCFTVSVRSHVLHHGQGDRAKISECARYVWPKRNLAKGFSSILLFLNEEAHSHNSGLMSWSCVWSRASRHFCCQNSLNFSFMELQMKWWLVGTTVIVCSAIAFFASWSVHSFP